MGSTTSARGDRRDDDNTSFDVPEPVLEDHRPGVIDRVARRPAAPAGHDDLDHRFRPRKKEDIPAVSLAERIRAAAKER